MRVLMLSWEYPPYVVGGLGKHTAELLPSLGNLPGMELHLVTPGWAGGAALEEVGNATIHRVTPPGADDDFYTTASKTNQLLEEYALELWEESGAFDLVHVHDWLVAFAGIAVKLHHRVPLLSTIHATERGRGRGSLATEQARSINQVEWQLTFESWRVIACSEYMAEEIGDYFQCPGDKIDVVPNGVDTERFDLLQGKDLSRFRSSYALSMEPIIFSVGRIVYEKGMQVLVRAMPAVLAEVPTSRAIIAGKGPELESLRSQAKRLGVGSRVQLAGFVSDEDRDRLFATSDCAVFPSLYEPFGIVALEAMAARCPVVVTDAGGLRDVVEHQVTGISTPPDDPDALARGILQCLENPAEASERVARAYRVVREEYNWQNIAEMTEKVYRRVIAERAITEW